MDRIIEPKKGLRFKKRELLYVISGVVVVLFAIWMIFGDHASTLNVADDNLLIVEAIEGDFNDYVRINGQVQPIGVVQLSAVEGGIVAEKMVEEGAMVEKGEIIVRLTNSMLNLNILDSEAQLAEKQNFLRNTQVAMEQDRLNLKREKLQLDQDVERKSRKAQQYSTLYSENLCSKEEFLQAKEDYDLAREGRSLVIERQRQDSVYRGIQILQMEESLQNMRKNLILIRQRVSSLNVTAPAAGQLGLLDVEIGQAVNAGTRIGQINILSGYKIETVIDEHYIDRVRPDLMASFERNGIKYNLRVRKVYPEVRDKFFKADMVFEGEIPNNIRSGQSYSVDLQLGQPLHAVMIPRGDFYHTTGGSWIYVLSSDGKKAVKRNISIGKQNPAFYEILSGLKSGDRVIVSGYESYKGAQELIIN